MATGSCQGIVKSIATTELLPWLQLAAVVIGGKNGAGALHTRIRPFSVRPTEHSICAQGILCVLAGLEAVLVRLLRGCMNKRYGVLTGDACAVLPSLCKADNFFRVIG